MRDELLVAAGIALHRIMSIAQKHKHMLHAWSTFGVDGTLPAQFHGAVLQRPGDCLRRIYPQSPPRKVNGKIAHDNMHEYVF